METQLEKMENPVDKHVDMVPKNLLEELVENCVEILLVELRKATKKREKKGKASLN